MEFKLFVRSCQGSLPEWYNENVHKKVCDLTFELGKLHACKFLCDYSTEMKTRELYGLKWSKEVVVDLIAGYVPSFNFHLGNVVVETNEINELREYVEEIQTKKKDSEDLSKHLSDFCFDVEATYQRFHGLDPDNWDIVH